VFGDPDRSLGDRRENIACLVKFAWTPIVRHTLVTGRASPDDPDLTRYWVERRRKVKPALDSYNLRLLAKQDGRCPLCGDHVLTADQPPQSPSGWERWWLGVVKRAIAADYLTHCGRAARSDETHLVHASCHRSLRVRMRRSPTDAAVLATSSGLA
jgi:RNA-directed DNA polymerase